MGKTIQAQIQELEIEICKSELKYRLTGEYNEFCKKKNVNGEKIRKLIAESTESHVINTNQYNDVLRYVGDQELLADIFEREVCFRNIRKKVDKKEYQIRLRELVKLRNEFATTAGFKNFIEYKYALWGIDKKILDKKIVNVSNQIKDKDILLDLREKLIQISQNDFYNTSKQKDEMIQMLEMFRLKLQNERVIIHANNLPTFYVGACVPISIPNEVHVMINMVAGLSGFSVFMHEIGHAFYYSNINNELEGSVRKPYNLILEEGMALFFENLVFTNDYLYQTLGVDDDLYLQKAEAFLPFQICCIKFEEAIYNDYSLDYQEVWNMHKQFYSKGKEEWTSPHFFVSEPGYFSAYFLGNCWAKDMYAYFQKNKNVDMNTFFEKEVCGSGRNINYSKLLDTICFLN